jgi:NADH:ubiquinone oxidoreductase subunit F (NADH-binding)/(2Fe-2S) ferredoxin
MAIEKKTVKADKIVTISDLEKRIKKDTLTLGDKFSGKDGKRHIVVCGGTSCLSSNSQKIYENIEKYIKDHKLSDKVTVNQTGCFGFCSQGPFVKIYPEDTFYHAVKPEDVEEIMEKDIGKHEIVERLLYIDPKTHEKVQKQKDINFYKKQIRIALHGCSIIDPSDFDEALGFDGMSAFAKALTMKPQEIIDVMSASGLRGRGGAGFPTGRKWQFAYNQQSDVKYVICNGDEGDPGAFMDRSILEGNPVNVIEGMMIAGYAIGAHQGYFYIRAEYPIACKRVEKALQEMEALGLLGDNILGSGFSFRIGLRYGAGAFVCGEETALMNSIEGKRGMPRPKPPFPAVKGLWGKPTIINNVETLANVPYILRVGAAEYAKIGTEKSKGTKVFALGGKINNVGLVEVPMGTTLRTLIFDIGGGIPNGKKFQAIQTGGPSGGCLTTSELDVPIDYDSLIAAGSMMGSGGAIVMDEDNCMVDVAKFYMQFICDESCGKCSQCRIGTKRLLEYMDKITEGRATLEDLDKIKELAESIKVGALCGLGQTAANPILSTLNKFHDVYIRHVVDKKCDAGVCKTLTTFSIDPNLCHKCSLCARNCPVGAITGVVGKEVFHIDPTKCIKCGTCITVCHFKAVKKD